MKVGFTGTREGMTEAQRISVLELIKSLRPKEAHHGDCIGADKEFADLCDVVSKSRVETIWMVSHPPKYKTLRAFTAAHEEREPKDYMPRNFDIVDECNPIIAAPKDTVKPKVLKGSGTWQTEDYAESKKREVYVVWPDGNVERIAPVSGLSNRRNKMKRSGMRAISIRQPYAEQILRGTKPFEYRSRPTNIRERVYIYASHTPGDPKAWKEVGMQPGDLPTGVLVGTVEIGDCKGVRGDYAYKLERPKRLKKPLKPKKHPQPVWFYPF